MKVYLAGPMRGYDNYNFQEFEQGASYLAWLGHEVVSPHEIDIQEGYVHAKFHYIPAYASFIPHVRRFSSVNLTSKFDIQTVLQRDIREVTQCDAIGFLVGSDDSVGARHEAYVASVCGLTFFEVVPWIYFAETGKSDQMKLAAEIQADYWSNHSMWAEGSF